MGMAASQARLLSITSRMSDNELRAQLINNAKMRLTTDSSQVSDDYIAALNATELMFTNYDTDGNEQYQELTFNSLTAYSSYNNQYGIVNNAGQILVSSTDADNYEYAQANGGDDKLNTFLACYGLSQTTTYFDEYDGNVGYYDDYDTWQDLGVSVGDMEEIYERYSADLNSDEYDTYLELVDNYDTTKETYNTLLKSAKNEYLDDLEIDDTYYTVSDLTSFSDNYFNKLEKILESLGVDRSADNWNNANDTNGILESDSEGYSTFISAMQSLYEQASTQAGTTADYYETDSTTKTYQYVEVDDDGNYTKVSPTEYYLVAATDDNADSYSGCDEITVGDETYYVSNEDDENAAAYYIYDFEEDADYQILYYDDDGNETLDETDNPVIYNSTTGSIIKSTYTWTDDDRLEALQACYTYLKNNVFNNLSDDYFLSEAANADSDSDDDYEQALCALNTAYGNYMDAAEALAEFIFGEDNSNSITEADYDNLSDIGWVMTTYTDDGATTDDYETIKNIFLVECMLDYYGEPNYTWIDENDSNEDGDAKAQWYTNLYERMEEGYAELPDNLLDSQEWLQFAFESGLVHMEQVDSSNNWVSTMYSNCSNITESTVDVDVTVAEAEYTREMNKIEAKDKQYDLELKNIDTEHSSLETEYESVKSVIDKNIERNFKIFQA